MNEKSLIPSIRFAGFTDAWERRKLGEIADKVTEKNSSRIYSETFTNSAENGIISQRDYFDHAVSNSANLDGYYIVSEDDFVYNPRISTTAPVGPINRNRLKRRGVMSPLYTVFRTRDIDALYLEHYFKSHHWHQYMFLNGDSGARSDRFSIKDFVFMEMPIAVPCKVEQMRIGSFLEELDRLITLHQRKLEKLLNIKKSMLDKMFPKNDELFPEVRFAGFTDAWERRKLGEIADKVTEKNSSRIYSETFTNSAENGIISQRDYFDHAVSNSANLDGYYIVSEDDFVYNPRISTTAPVGPINRNRLKRRGVMSPLYTVFRTRDIDALYLEHYFKSHHWHQYMFLNGDSGARSDRFSIKDFVFMEMPIAVPCKVEQMRIGSFLEELDRLITLHQRKLEKLQNIKKACLEKMFV